MKQFQAEIEQLTTEIDRVAETTKFNETYLLQGSTDGNTATVTLSAADAGLVGTMNEDRVGGTSTFTVTLTVGEKVKIGGVEYTVVAGTDDTSDIPSENKFTVGTLYGKIKDALEQANKIGDTAGTAAVANNDNGTFTITHATTAPAKPLSFSLHVGADADMSNKIIVDITSMTAEGLGIAGMDVADDTGVAATYAIDRIAEAIASVSEQRSALGAVQNRLEHTIANLDNVVENTTAAESRIRDTDMAEEMVEYSKNNILMQAGQSVLAQANQSTQGVLSLLQ